MLALLFVQVFDCVSQHGARHSAGVIIKKSQEF
jgi:hypothetical protein